MVKYDAVLISGLLLCMLRSQSRLGRLFFSLFLKVDNKSCHPQKEKYSNIILNEDADASNQPVNIDLNGRSVCARAPDDTRTCTFHV